MSLIDFMMGNVGGNRYRTTQKIAPEIPSYGPVSPDAARDAALDEGPQWGPTLQAAAGLPPLDAMNAPQNIPNARTYAAEIPSYGPVSPDAARDAALDEGPQWGPTLQAAAGLPPLDAMNAPRSIPNARTHAAEIPAGTDARLAPQAGIVTALEAPQGTNGPMVPYTATVPKTASQGFREGFVQPAIPQGQYGAYAPGEGAYSLAQQAAVRSGIQKYNDRMTAMNSPAALRIMQQHESEMANSLSNGINRAIPNKRRAELNQGVANAQQMAMGAQRNQGMLDVAQTQAAGQVGASNATAQGNLAVERARAQAAAQQAETETQAKLAIARATPVSGGNGVYDPATGAWSGGAQPKTMETLDDNQLTNIIHNFAPPKFDTAKLMSTDPDLAIQMQTSRGDAKIMDEVKRQWQARHPYTKEMQDVYDRANGIWRSRQGGTQKSVTAAGAAPDWKSILK